MVFVASSNKEIYHELRDMGLTKKEIGERLSLNRQTLKNYEDSYKPSGNIVKEKVIQGTTTAVTETITKPSTQWDPVTITPKASLTGMTWVGISVGVLFVIVLICYGLYRLWCWWSGEPALQGPSGEKVSDFDIKKVSKDVIERVHSWYADDLKRKDLELERERKEMEAERRHREQLEKEKEDELKRLEKEKEEERLRREHAEKELEEIKKVCSPRENSE